jgi:hypothetical protein
MRLAACVFGAFLLSGCSPDVTGPEKARVAAGQSLSQTPSTATELHKELITNTNYDVDQVKLTVSPSQIIVAVTNSNLLKAPHPDRDADAARIAHVLETQIAARSELAGIQAIHVDYLAREDGSAPRISDSMDFRRAKSGRFLRDDS